MSTKEYLELGVLGVAFLGLVVSIMRLWIRTKTDIAALQQRQLSFEKEIMELKKDHMKAIDGLKDDFTLRLDRIEEKNSEQHKLLFEKISEMSVQVTRVCTTVEKIL